MEKERAMSVGRFRSWLVLRFLPTWAKETVFKENEELRQRNLELKSEIYRLKAYINGLEYGMKRRITINNGVDK